MDSHHHSPSVPPLDLSKWRNLPWILIAAGGLGVIGGGALLGKVQFGYCWLVAFMFFLSLALGSFFLVLAHHMFDASWSIPVRRITESLSNTFPALLVLFIPIAVLAKDIYPWMSPEMQAHP